MNRIEASRLSPDLIEVGSKRERRIQEIERLSWNLNEFLKNRDPKNPEETVNLLYNTFCELDEQFTGGDCTIESREEIVKKDIAEFVESLPRKFGEKDNYKSKLSVDLCYGAMKVSLREVNRGHGAAINFGTISADQEITETFLGNKIYKPEIK